MQNYSKDEILHYVQSDKIIVAVVLQIFLSYAAAAGCSSNARNLNLRAQYAPFFV